MVLPRLRGRDEGDGGGHRLGQGASENACLYVRMCVHALVCVCVCVCVCVTLWRRGGVMRLWAIGSQYRVDQGVSRALLFPRPHPHLLPDTVLS